MKVPFRKTFSNAKKCEQLAEYSLYAATLFTLGIAIFKYITDHESNAVIILNGLVIFSILIYHILIVVENYLFFEASRQKRADLIDNSFHTQLAEDNSEQYYSNDNLGSGLYKLAVNSFENTFFTYNISKEMLLPVWLKNALFGFFILVLSIYGYNQILILVLQVSLPMILLIRALKLTFFVQKVSDLNERFRSLFNDLKSKNKYSEKTPEILISVIDYESTLSWGNVLLDDNLYEKLNPELTEKWEQMKNRYGIGCTVEDIQFDQAANLKHDRIP